MVCIWSTRERFPIPNREHASVLMLKYWLPRLIQCNHTAAQHFKCKVPGAFKLKTSLCQAHLALHCKKPTFPAAQGSTRAHTWSMAIQRFKVKLKFFEAPCKTILLTGWRVRNCEWALSFTRSTCEVHSIKGNFGLKWLRSCTTVAKLLDENCIVRTWLCFW